MSTECWCNNLVYYSEIQELNEFVNIFDYEYYNCNIAIAARLEGV